MLPRTTSIWQRDSQPNASGKPGAVHFAVVIPDHATHDTDQERYDFPALSAFPPAVERPDHRLLTKIGGQQTLVADEILRPHDKPVTLLSGQGRQPVANLIRRQIWIVFLVFGDGRWIDG